MLILEALTEPGCSLADSLDESLAGQCQHLVGFERDPPACYEPRSLFTDVEDVFDGALVTASRCRVSKIVFAHTGTASARMA
jgi:hypothetical protein